MGGARVRVATIQSVGGRSGRVNGRFDRTKSWLAARLVRTRCVAVAGTFKRCRSKVEGAESQRPEWLSRRPVRTRPSRERTYGTSAIGLPARGLVVVVMQYLVGETLAGTTSRFARSRTRPHPPFMTHRTPQVERHDRATSKAEASVVRGGPSAARVSTQGTRSTRSEVREDGTYPLPPPGDCAFNS